MPLSSRYGEQYRVIDKGHERNEVRGEEHRSTQPCRHPDIPGAPYAKRHHVSEKDDHRRPDHEEDLLAIAETRKSMGKQRPRQDGEQ